MRKQKLPLRARISRALEVADDTLGGVSGISIYGSHTLVADGCQGVLSYTDDQVIFRLNGQTITLSGKALQLSAFRDCRITVRGQIDGLLFGKEGAW